MSLNDANRTLAIREVIAEFLRQRRDDKLEKLAPEDPKRSELHAQFIPAVWLEDAARRVSQIQAVTHSLKPIHPDAKGSSLYCEPGQLPATDALGSHSLGAQYDTDVVGNAAALDVYKLLKLSHGGKTLLDLAVSGDADLAAALSDDPAKGKDWLQSFAALATPRGKPSSHTNAKQLYWLVGDDPHDEQSFHLLAPLYPTSLVHRVYQALQDDRFSEDAKAARAARKAVEAHARPVREYPNLAIQKLGGTKPQNISQLNSERRGDNCMLASLPPVWKSAQVRPPLHADSLFKAYGRRTEARQQAVALKLFLKDEPPANVATRDKVRGHVIRLIDELLQYQAELLTLSPGWSASEDCELPAAQCLWLDPDAAQALSEAATEEASEQVAADFARWVNAQLYDPLPVGDPEFLFWRKLAREEFAAQAREAA
ncbi:type I-F CRISPR-associated protein Csy1 [Roseateles koreensis]|uniref:Type I-F CRISPR-associated protein Csy1 n=1 Tax=Roseateles koreensis TaxID=2987526 RepID=A0ABT5KN77_9BURK|nr:type I-F CRISPR-associated protein Csy1 [Roseateles koreensis]MDC8784382.1 type I-F CRISPR-associated protein Csy1 [Roseateles koreensis]